MGRHSVTFTDDLEKKIQSEIERREIMTLQAAVVQAIEQWINGPEVRPELPKGMNRDEALLCAEMLRWYNSSEMMKKIIPAYFKSLRPLLD